MLLQESKDALQGVLESPTSGIEHPLFGVGEAAEVGGEGIEDLSVEVLQVPVELGGGSVQGRAVLVRRRRDAGGPGVPEEVFPDRVGGRGLPGGQEGERLARPQGVSPGDVAQADLPLLGQGGEGQGHIHGERSRIEAGLQLRGELLVEREPLADPALPMAEQLADGGGAEAVLIGIRGHDAGLVHGAGCPPRGVRLEQPRLGEKRRGVLDDHRGLLAAVGLPGAQALEAVDHLVGPVGLLDDPDREGAEGVPRVGAVPPEVGEGGPEPVCGDVADGAHGPSRERI